ncbi:MAG: hypothetical protein ACREHG_08540, partial [Candidatus Saccharimonadales bacterium]
DGSYAFASHFRQPQSFNKEEKAGKSKKIVIPSWRQQFESLVDMIHQIIGDRAPPFNLRLNLIEDSIKNTFSETNHSNTLIPLEFSIPVSVKKSDSEEGFSWQIDALTVPAHEYLHTYFFYAAKHPPLNSVSNEIVAYTFQRCVEIGLMHGEGGLEFDDHGKPINVNRIPLPGIKLSSDQVAPTSIDGGLYSIYNIVHFLGKDEIKSSDLAAKQRLFGLCSAMIHRPVDLSKEYYPTNAG